MSTEHEALRAAGDLLDSVLDRYTSACLAVQKIHLERRPSIVAASDLSDRIESESQFAVSLELKMHKAKAIINRTRNDYPTLVPVHKLPPELISRIFLIAFNSQPKSDWSNRPETISHVCSRWREIALGEPSLWNHISLPLACDVDATHTVRGTAFASRARSLPLNIRLSNPSDTTLLSEPINIKTFVDSVALRIGTLELVTDRETDLEEYERTLSSYLSRCEDGALKTLITSHDERIGVLFGLPKDLDDEVWENDLGDYLTLPTDEFDQVLASLTTLRLNGLYPFWASEAYHGLVELRLNRGSLDPTSASITEEYLVGIIGASPALRILEFSLTIIEDLPAGSSVSPILLEHLEVLNIALLEAEKVGSFLRWLYPGSKPLQLAIPNDWLVGRQEVPTLGPSYNDITSFFARSRVTKIYTDDSDYSDILELADLSPHLKILACHGVRDCRPYLPEQGLLPLLHSTLESLWILDGLVHTALLLDVIVGIPSLERILFWKCRYYDSNSSSITHREPLCTSNLEAIAGRGFDARIVNHDPTLDWEIFAP